MPLVRMDDLLIAARRDGYAVAAFECWSSGNVIGLCEAAATCRMPVILQASPVEYGLMGGPEALKHIVDFYVARHGITAALHLDHGSTLAHVEECVRAGFTSVMLDASRETLDRNIELSRAATQLAHAANVSVEAELGHVGGSEGGFTDHGGEHPLTVPDEAVRFVAETGIDCLAVAIGTIHGDYRSEPRIRLDLLADIAKRIPQPLVLHGGSGTPHDVLRQAIRLGIAKINICTDINKAWLAGVEEARADRSLTPSVPGAFYRPAHRRLVEVASAMIRLFAEKAASAG